MVTKSVAARRAQHNGIAAAHAGRRYGGGHGIASRHRRRRAGHHTAAMQVMIVVQMLGLATTVAVDVAVCRNGEMHFFHGPSFGLGGLAAAVRDFCVFEQGL